MIEKRIHRIWFGEAEHPPIVRECLKSFPPLHPDWAFHHHGRPDLLSNVLFKQLPLQKRWDDIGRLDVAPHRMWAFRSDLYRLLVLYVWGGFYLDHDFWCIRPLDRFCGDELVLMQFKPGMVGEGIIAAPARSPRIWLLIQHCLKQQVCKLMTPRFGPASRQHGWHSYPPEVFCPHKRMNDAANLYRCTDKTHLIHVWHRDYEYDVGQLKELQRQANEKGQKAASVDQEKEARESRAEASF